MIINMLNDLKEHMKKMREEMEYTKRNQMKIWACKL